MKKLSSIIFAFAALTFAAVSCVEETTPYEPGEPEEAGCYGVYFPVQDATGSHTYDPTMPTSVEFTVARTNTSGAITVPVTYTESESGIFQVGTISFADGQSETTLEVNFPNSGIGVNYELSLTIDDPQYASKYNDSLVSVDFSVLRVEWKYILDPKTGEPATFEFWQDWWGETAWAYVKYYEVDGIRTCQTETFLHDYAGDQYDDPGFWGYGSDYEWTFYIYLNSKRSDGGYNIRLAPNNTGYYHSSYADWVYALDLFYWNTSSTDHDKFLTWAKSADESTISYYDNNGGIYFYVRSYYMFSVGGWGQSYYETIGIGSGFTRTDYSIEMETDYAQNGQMPVYLTTGVDVASVKVAAFEGELTATQTENKIAAVIDGSEASVSVPTADFDLNEDDAVLEGTAYITLPASGVYTVVAVSCDAAGAAQESASAVQFYVTADDTEDYAVEFAVGTEATPARYSDYDNMSSFAYFITGKDITDAHVGIVKSSSFEEALLDEVKNDEDYCLGASAVAAINGAGGYYDIISGCSPLTSYTVIVWATNGSADGFSIAEFTTDGLPRELVGTGTYTYAQFWTGDDEGLECYSDPNYEGKYVITSWGYGVDFEFYDNGDGTVSIPTQWTGYNHSSYGPVYVLDSKDYWSAASLETYPELGEPSKWDKESGVITFNTVYAVSAGYFGYGEECFTFDGASASAVSVASKTVSVDFTSFNSPYFKVPADPHFERELSSAAVEVISVEGAVREKKAASGRNTSINEAVRF